MAGRISTCDPHIERETLQVNLYVPRALSFVGAHQGSRLSENGDGSREGFLRALLATKIAWPNAMRFFLWGYVKDCAFLPTLPQDLPELRRRISLPSQIDRDMLQRIRAEMDYRLDVCRATKGGHIEHLWGMQKKIWRVSLSICRSHVTILSAIQVYPFYEICQGILNNPVYKLLIRLRYYIVHMVGLTWQLRRCRLARIVTINLHTYEYSTKLKPTKHTFYNRETPLIVFNKSATRFGPGGPLLRSLQ
jgi:hypothetical protein